MANDFATGLVLSHDILLLTGLVPLYIIYLQGWSCYLLELLLSLNPGLQPCWLFTSLPDLWPHAPPLVIHETEV
ncbi:hypothetical protein XENTR_v10018917 [Xenopus tropicalis]|nr:hypothetical protein XENTR_v10018917 [Xenopus tropicalis]